MAASTANASATAAAATTSLIRVGGLRRCYASPTNAPPRGVLVAHYAEHAGAVTALAVAPASAYFASGGADGCVRLFDTRAIERRAMERARIVHHCNASASGGDVATPIRALCVVDGGSLLAVGTDAGSLLTIAVDQQSNAQHTMQKLSGARVVRRDELREGAVLAARSFDDQSRHRTLLCCATALGGVRAVDLRQAPRAAPALAFQCSPSMGAAVSLLLDERDGVWLCAGTTRGALALFDLRYAGRGSRRRSTKTSCLCDY